MLKHFMELLYCAFIFAVLTTLLPSESNAQCIPYANCVSTFNISLDNNGIATVPAHILDNGSSDTCAVPPGPVWFKVKRMMVPDSFDCYTPGNPDYRFDDFVQLCCEDIGDSVRVILRVYNIDPGVGPVDDTVGTNHFNDCMLTLFAIDKIPPTILCPPDTTIECGALYSDYSQYGDPVVTDNCDSFVIEIVIDTQLNICNVGQVRRKFIVTDAGGLKDSCVQIITVVNNHPFDGNDPNQLIWPSDTFVYGCYDYVDTSLSGKPVIIEDECDLVGVDFEDQSYYFGKNSACYKIIRVWKVLDWCQYDPKRGCVPSNGCWTHEQIIKVVDTIPPVVTGVKDTTINNFSVDCSALFIQLDTAMAYDCDSSLIQRFRVEVDLYSDGSVDTSFSGNDASGFYPNGVHRISFLAFDRCGNIGDSTIVLTVQDAKAPSPIGLPGIAVNLNQMQNGIMAMVRARQLDHKSYDNCTPASRLRFSFSPDVNDTLRIYNCDSILNSSVRNVELWVTDESGNQDYIKTFVFVQDNLGLCPGNLRNTVYGLVKDPKGAGLKGIQVELLSDGSRLNSMSDVNGLYEKRSIPSSSTLKVRPVYTSDPLKGITTRDLVAIKKYLLGIDQLPVPWGVLAADVDMSNSVSARDISVLRNLLLRKTDSYPKGSAWRFVLSDHHFIDPSDPFASGIPDMYVIHNYEGGNRIDFTGVKLGDVVSEQRKNSPREGAEIQGILQPADTPSEWLLSLDRTVDLSGLYIEMRLDASIGDIDISPSNLRGLNTTNYYLNPEDHILRLSWEDGYGITIFEGQPLMRIRFNKGKDVQVNATDLFADIKGHIVLNSGGVLPLRVAYVEGAKVGGEVVRPLSNLLVSPNPFNSEFHIEWKMLTADQVIITLLDQMGREVYRHAGEYGIGEHRLEVTEVGEWSSGVYLCTVKSSGDNATVRVIKVGP